MGKQEGVVPGIDGLTRAGAAVTTPVHAYLKAALTILASISNDSE